MIRKCTLFTAMGILVLSVMTGCGGNKPAPDADTGSELVETTEDAVDYPISEDSLDMDGFLVRINTEGLGQIARAEEGRVLEFDEEYPAQSTADHLAEGTKLQIAAKADAGWRFRKWTLNGADYSTDEQISYTVTEDAELIAVFEAEEEQVSEGLPAYVYPGDDSEISAICDYITTNIASDYEKAEVSIPYMRIVDTDDSNPDDILVWGDFWIDNYNLDGSVLVSQSGGNYPGLMHLKNNDGVIEVTGFEGVEDGEGFVSSAKKIFGSKYEEFEKISSDQDAREKVRAEYIKGYVKANGLEITAYQDYGWDPVELS